MQVFAFVASAYTLTVATESNIRTLQSDVPYSSSVGKDRLMLFQSPLPASHLDQYNLRVSVSATSGRVGVYVSCVNHSPSNVSHDYALYYPASSSSSSATAAWQDLSGLGLRDLGCDRGTGSWLYLSVQGDGVAASSEDVVTPTSPPPHDQHNQPVAQLTMALGHDSMPLSVLFDAMNARPESSGIVQWALRQTTMEEVRAHCTFASSSTLFSHMSPFSTYVTGGHASILLHTAHHEP